METKIYCKDCKYCDYNRMFPIISECLHPNNMYMGKDGGASTAVEPTNPFKCFGYCDMVNKKNNCKLFEVKTVSIKWPWSKGILRWLKSDK